MPRKREISGTPGLSMVERLSRRLMYHAAVDAVVILEEREAHTIGASRLARGPGQAHTLSPHVKLPPWEQNTRD